MRWTLGLDWGTTRLRALLMDGNGQVREERIRDWGIRQLPAGGFDAALAEVCAGWPVARVIACGMVGSRQGWREAPYVDAPVAVGDLTAALTPWQTADGQHLDIVPGVRDASGPDVMRGEETQVFGALAAHPALAAAACLVLPGTHSKWVQVRDARIVRLATMMTGELYGLLCRHSILGAVTDAAAAATEDARDAAFAAGVRAARDSGAAGVLTQLFSARVLMLEARLAPAVVPDYLSGLLIGEEWRAALAAGWHNSETPVALVGDATLCTRYRKAAAMFDLPEPMAVSDATARGLWQIGLAIAAARLEVS
ncbi:MAG TPA: 2-dehydro-3-deoxygalactonokinase [Rhodanobacteraceae bacterium]